jgi:hypothetical protein
MESQHRRIGGRHVRLRNEGPQPSLFRSERGPITSPEIERLFWVKKSLLAIKDSGLPADMPRRGVNCASEANVEGEVGNDRESLYQEALNCKAS